MIQTCDAAVALIDRATLLDRVGDDEALLVEIANIFLDELPGMLNEIRSAVESGDAKRLEHSAHTLKGSVSNFGARTATQAAFELESIGRQRRMNEARAAYSTLESEFEALRPALLSLVA